MICDFAESYHIYDWRSLPVRTAATLAVGLRPDSRVKMRLSGFSISQRDQLMASILDGVNWLVWSKTEDAEKNRNRPKSVLSLLMDEEEKPSQYEGYSTGEEFEMAKAKILDGVKNGS